MIQIKTLIIAICLATVILIASTCWSSNKKYDIRLTFCDGRPPVTITVERRHRPSNNDIATDRQAVPTYNTCGCDGNTSEKYLNVCDVQVIKEYQTAYKRVTSGTPFAE